MPYDHREMLTDIRNSIDRYLKGGGGPVDPPPVQETCPLSSELIQITKSGVYKDCVIDGHIEVLAPDVTFQNLRLTGTNPHYTLFTAGLRTRLENCDLVGSFQGQHRGVRVDNKGIRLINTRVRNIWSNLVSDTQAVAGWDGCKDLVIDGGEYWGCTENIIFGGSPCPLEENIPQDILIQNILMDKDLTWMDKQHGQAKNIFELKNAKRLTMKNVVMRHSWAFDQGQGGEGIVLTLRQERPEHQPAHNVIEDIVLEGITVENVASGINILGRDNERLTDHCVRRMLLKDINFKGFDRHKWGGNGFQFQIGLGTEDLTIDNVQFKGGPHEAYYQLISFYGLETPGFPYENLRLVIKNSTFNEGTYAIHGSGMDVTGNLEALAKYAPGYVWENVVVEDQQGYYKYPPGTKKS